MPTRTEPRVHRRQCGAALLILLLALSVGLAGALLGTRESSPGTRAADAVENATILARARGVLLSRALADGNRPGTLTCPASGEHGKGVIDGDWCDPELGRFPYRTLQIDPLRTADGEQLWYAMDQSLRDRLSAQPVNPQEKGGGLRFNGEDGYAAVLLAPGPPLPDLDQRRDGDADVGDYLEGGNDNEEALAFTNCRSGDDCNDRAVGISADELFHRIQRRLARRVAAELRDFYTSKELAGDGYLPYAANFGSEECDANQYRGQLALKDEDGLSEDGEDGTGDCGGDAGILTKADFRPDDYEEDGDFKGWIEENEWFKFIVYHVDPKCTSEQRSCDESTLKVDGRPVQAVVAAAGRALSELGQSDRPADSVQDYLDNPANYPEDSDMDYVVDSLGPERNDVIVGIDVIGDES